MRRGLTALAALVGAFALLAIGAGAATTTLPGGTGFTVAVSAPAAGAVLPEATPFVVSGHATIGTATPVANTYLVTAIDVSGSTDLGVSTSSCGNQNPTHDFAANTVLDCELAAGLALNNEAVNQGTVAQVGLIGFAGRQVGTFAPLADEASILDLSAAGGQQSFTPPAADSPANGTRDVNEVLASAYNQNISPTFGLSGLDNFVGFTKFTDFTSVGNTNYWAAVTQIRNLFATAPAGVTKIAVILSDGDSTVGGPSGEHVEQALSGISGIKIFTFAIGNAASCLGSGAPNYGTLQTIASTTGATCTKIANPGDAANIVPDAIGSSISVPVLSDDGGATYVSPDGGIPPVFHGPGSIDFHHTFPAADATPGPHHLCARAIGSDGGGNATLADCVDVSILARPVVTTDGIGGVFGATTEGSPFTVSGSADHGDTTWSATGGTGTCTFANASSPTTDVTCTDDGDYTITLTADDHVNAPQSASGTLHVSNVDPTAALTLSAGPHPLAQPVDASVAISDPGADTFSCVIDWGDGTSGPGAVSGNACTGSHTYATAGFYSVSTTVTDDDGGTGSDATSVRVDAPPTIDLGGGGGGVGLSGVEGAPVALHASVTDDTAGLTLHWSATAGAGVDAGASCSFGNAASAATTVACTDDGDWQLTLTADDHVNPPVSGTIALHLENANPTLSLASGVSSLTATVTGTVGDAGANDTQTCSFSWGDGSADTTGVPVSGGTCVASHAYASGAHPTVTVTATDDDGGSATRSVSITLNRPPSCTAVSSSLTELWPPDHTLQLIVLGGATDPDHDTLTYAITSVRQDEPTNGTGDGDTAIDAVNAGPGAVRLRAERSGNGDGRVYTITFTVSDGKGGSCGGTVQVSVPKSASKPAVLSPGPGYDSYH
jgi:trimeric autotransporter adhesin